MITQTKANSSLQSTNPNSDSQPVLNTHVRYSLGSICHILSASQWWWRKPGIFFGFWIFKIELNPDDKYSLLIPIKCQTTMPYIYDTTDSDVMIM